MPMFLDPTNRANYGLGLCARCGQKFFLDELYDDPNYPGIKVCQKHDDIDEYDPYRLPAREPDPIVLEFVRPDFPISTPAPATAPEQPGWPPADAVSPDGVTFIPGT